jgi:hypothetical protein
MNLKPGKGAATGYSDFYKRSGNPTPGAKKNKLELAASSSPGVKPTASSPFKNRPVDDDEEDDDLKKAALRRRLKKFRKAGK